MNDCNWLLSVEIDCDWPRIEPGVTENFSLGCMIVLMRLSGLVSARSGYQYGVVTWLVDGGKEAVLSAGLVEAASLQVQSQVPGGVLDLGVVGLLQLEHCSKLRFKCCHHRLYYSAVKPGNMLLSHDN